MKLLLFPINSGHEIAAINIYSIADKDFMNMTSVFLNSGQKLICMGMLSNINVRVLRPAASE